MSRRDMPEAPFSYCPNCARPATMSRGREFRCAACAFRYFHNVASAVAALIVCGGQLLTTVRAHQPAQGTLDLPGGFVEPGETAEQALARELAEELGWAALPAPPRYQCSVPNTYPYATVTYATLDSFFLIECAACPAVQVGAEIETALWLPRQDLDVTRFGFTSVRTALALLDNI